MMLMESYTGKNFYPLQITIDDLCIDDIAHALSNICRFAGHCSTFYSVARHSIFVSKLMFEYTPPQDAARAAMVGLMHDASEAYMCDIPTPIKEELPEYQKHENNLHKVIDKFAGIDREEFEDGLALADSVALYVEAKNLMSFGKAWEPFSEFMEAGDHISAEDEKLFARTFYHTSDEIDFLNRFRTLSKIINN